MKKPVLIITHQATLGDVVCAEPVVMAIAHKHPDPPPWVLTPHPEVFEGYPAPLHIVTDLYELRSQEFSATYGAFTDGNTHLTRGLAARLNLVLPYTVPRYYGPKRIANPPYIVVSNDANDKARQLTDSQLEELTLALYQKGIYVVLMGRHKGVKELPCLFDFRGRTTKKEMYQAAAGSIGGVVADSGLSHVIASLGKPYVVWGALPMENRHHEGLTYWIAGNAGDYPVNQIIEEAVKLFGETGG